MAELDALDPVPEQCKLTSGTVVVLQDLRARQFFKLLRIVTHGAMPLIQDGSLLRLDGDMDVNEFGGRLLSLMLLSIPDAEEETIAFVQSMCEPYGLITGRKLNKQDSERNTVLWDTLQAELENPELDDLVTIVEAIIRREADDLQALGKRLIAMFKLAEKTGQVPSQLQIPQTLPSSADSPDPSTSSATSTDGPTTSSGTSPSDDSASASPPSGSDASTPAGTATSG